MRHEHLRTFVERFKRFQHFETFQKHFSELGILCYIIPDWYKQNYDELTWRGIIEWKENGEWHLDDCGSYQNLDECRTSLIEMVLDFCYDHNIDFLK